MGCKLLLNKKTMIVSLYRKMSKKIKSFKKTLNKSPIKNWDIVSNRKARASKFKMMTQRLSQIQTLLFKSKARI